MFRLSALAPFADGANMLVSSYFTHEGRTNIYLAVVPRKKSL